jgi:peptide deformylase
MKVFDIVTDKKFLAEKCEEVSFPLETKDRDTLLEMVEYLKVSQDDELAEKYNIRPGVGLAANQIGIKKKMIAVYFQDEDRIHEYGLVNPKIVSYSVKLCCLDGGEGCLSVPKDVEGYVYRYYKITVKGFDVITNKEVTIKARGYLSVILQHELDHLDGKLYTDRIDKNDPFKVIEDAILI